MEYAKLIPAVKNNGIYEMARDFIRPHEKISCQLSEFLCNQNKNVFSVLSTSGDSISVSGIFYCSKGGTVLPFFNLPFLKEKKDFIRRSLLDFFYGRKIFCVSGESSSVDFLTEILLSVGNQRIKERRFFISMESENQAEKMCGKRIPGISFFQCTRENSDEIFSMQIDYIKEEVLPEGMSLNLPVERFEMDRLLKKGKIYAVATEDEILCKAQINAETDSGILIGGVYTKTQQRRKGFARMMMENLKSLATNAGKSCVLFVNEKNGAAISLYEKTGFERIGAHEIVYME